MNKTTWKDEYRLGPWRSIVGHRRLSDWVTLVVGRTPRKLIERLDQSHLFGACCLVGGVLLIVALMAMIGN
jgi:fucose permease